MNYCDNCEGVAKDNGMCDACEYITAYAERDSGRNTAPLSKACYSHMLKHFASLYEDMGIDSRQEGYDAAELAASDHGKIWAYAEHFKYFRRQMMAA